MQFYPHLFKRAAALCAVLALCVFMQACKTDTGAHVKWPTAAAPVANVKPTELPEHGAKRTDNYFWLRDDKVRTNDISQMKPEVVEYLRAEAAYTDTMMADTKGLRDKLFEEIKGRIKQDDNSVPYFRNGYWYYTRFETGKNYPIYCRKQGKLENAEIVILDCNKEAEGKKYYNAAPDVSIDGNVMAIVENTTGDDMYSIRFQDLRTGKNFSEKIANTAGGEWAADNKTYLYNKRDPQTQRVFKVARHVLGTDAKADVEMYHEQDEIYNCQVGRTRSDKYLVIESSSTLTSEFQILEADKPTGKFRVFAPRTKDVLYDVDHHNGSFFVRTNKDGAQNFKLMRCTVTATAMNDWKEVVAHRADVLLEDFLPFQKHLIVTEREKGLLKKRIYALEANSNLGAGRYIDFQDPVYTVYSSANPTFETATFRYVYNSLTTPNSTYDYDMNTGEKKLLKQEEVLGGKFKAEDYESKRLFAKAADGAEVPISLVYRKDLKKAGNPLWITAYGSYGSSYDATFSSARLSLLDRGFVFAIAHVRGGEDLGRQWYLDGKLMKKKNTFTDFIACTEYLQKEGYTTPELTIANGGSAGGLLMGAITNMAPQDYKGVVADVPFVDVISTMMDASIPLTTNEWDEWGNPIKDKAAYDYMLSYSPYDQIEKKNYPSILVTTGLFDSRVAYWEPSKYVAKLRAMKTDNNVLLFKINMDAGHGGASGRYERYKEAAFRYAFALKLLGIAQ